MDRRFEIESEEEWMTGRLRGVYRSCGCQQQEASGWVFIRPGKVKVELDLTGNLVSKFSSGKAHLKGHPCFCQVVCKVHQALPFFLFSTTTIPAKPNSAPRLPWQSWLAGLDGGVRVGLEAGCVVGRGAAVGLACLGT